MTPADWLFATSLILLGIVLGETLRNLHAALQRAARRVLARHAPLSTDIEAQAATSAATDRAAAAATAPPCNDGWFALPGGTRLEYQASGFAIELRPANAAAPYCLLTPEGTLLAAGQVLFQLKGMGAFAARERAQFSPSSGHNGAPT